MDESENLQSVTGILAMHSYWTTKYNNSREAKNQFFRKKKKKRNYRYFRVYSTLKSMPYLFAVRPTRISWRCCEEIYPFKYALVTVSTSVRFCWTALLKLFCTPPLPPLFQPCWNMLKRIWIHIEWLRKCVETVCSPQQSKSFNIVQQNRTDVALRLQIRY